MTDKPQFIDPPGLWKSPRYTQIVVANGFAFIAGQTAFDTMATSSASATFARRRSRPAAT